MSDISKQFLAYISKVKHKTVKRICDGTQVLSSVDFPELYSVLEKLKERNPNRFETSEENFQQHLQENSVNYKYYIDSEKIILPKYSDNNVSITVLEKEPPAPFNISTETVTIRQGDTLTIPFTNDECQLTITSQFNLVNITENANNLVLKAVTDDNGSDHITITASKDDYADKVINITVIVPDVYIESDLLAVQLNESNPYSDVTVTTNGDDISYTIDQPNVVVSQISQSRAENNDLVRVYRITGQYDGSAIVTFNSLVDNEVIETCTVGCTISDRPFINFTASNLGSNIDLFSTSSNFNTSDYDVYINGSKTSQTFNSLTFNTNDRVQIKANKNVNFYPYFYAYNQNYIKTINSALPLMSADNTNAVTNLGYCFRSCESLVSIPSDLFKYNTEATRFDFCFCSCTSLTSVPSDLFEYNTIVDNFENCFDRCTSLASIPSDLFKYNTEATRFDFCFRGCSSLTSMPSDLFKNNTQVSSFSRCFDNCTSLISVPSDLFKNNTQVIDFSGCFYNCRFLTSNVPELWTTHPYVSHKNCFKYCTNAANYGSIPDDWKN